MVYDDNRLTNDDIAINLFKNIMALKEIGISPNISDVRYIKLALLERYFDGDSCLLNDDFKEMFKKLSNLMTE
jgi:hypothetical protein